MTPEMVGDYRAAGWMTSEELGGLFGINAHQAARKAVMANVPRVPMPRQHRSHCRVLYAPVAVERLQPKDPSAGRAGVTPRQYLRDANERRRDEAREVGSAILAVVAEAYGFTVDDLLAINRDPLAVEARGVAMLLISERDIGATHIGLVMRREHATVLHHLTRIKNKPTFEEREMLKDLRKQLGQKRGVA